MGTTTYFEKTVTDFADKKNKVDVELGTTNYGGEGPQMYVNFGNQSLLLSHRDAKAFAQAVDKVASYLGYSD